MTVPSHLASSTLVEIGVPFLIAIVAFLILFPVMRRRYADRRERKRLSIAGALAGTGGALVLASIPFGHDGFVRTALAAAAAIFVFVALVVAISPLRRRPS